MMSSRGHIKDNAVAAESWRDDSDIRQMGPAEFGMVGNNNIARL
jgi:hypothetical protein